MGIGSRLRKLRSAKKVTLKRLAEATGLTVSFISQLERDKISPSLKSLRKIADVLKIKVTYFFEEDEDKKDFIFIKNASQRYFYKRSKSSQQPLISDLMNVKLQPSLIRLGSGGRLKDSFQYIGEEFGFVFKGEVSLYREGQRFILRKGDFIYFVSIRPKIFSNISQKEALILWAQLKEI